MRMQSIASGSSGNSIYVGNDNTHILVDAGISGKRIEAGLQELELCGKDVDAILITHEHSDHIGGLGVMSRRYGIPIYATEGTIGEIKHSSSVGKIDPGLFHEIHADEELWIKDMKVLPFAISHDAAEPVAYTFCDGEKKSAIVTDLGMYDDYTVSKLQNMDVLFLEANHDVRMLQMGRYPYPLKQRILGKKGHLSNEASGRLLTALLHDKMKQVFLSHLSMENNLPELAFEAVRLEVTMSDSPYRGDDFKIEIAKRSQPSPCICI